MRRKLGEISLTFGDRTPAVIKSTKFVLFSFFPEHNTKWRFQLYIAPSTHLFFLKKNRNYFLYYFHKKNNTKKPRNSQGIPKTALMR